MVDLDAYDYTPGATSAIRATERTVPERIPPRQRVRRDAPIELPHVLMLCDDHDKKLIEPIAAKKDSLKKIYDFDLMEDGGHITGWLVEGKDVEDFNKALTEYSATVGESTPASRARRWSSPSATATTPLLPPRAAMKSSRRTTPASTSRTIRRAMPLSSSRTSTTRAGLRAHPPRHLQDRAEEAPQGPRRRLRRHRRLPGQVVHRRRIRHHRPRQEQGRAGRWHPAAFPR